MDDTAGKQKIETVERENELRITGGSAMEGLIAAKSNYL